MFYYYLILLFLFGLIVGSFLSVVVSRLENDGESIVTGRSRCPKCKHKIANYDLVPVLSFFILKGRCRNCKAKISAFYPTIEIVTGLLFSLLYLRFHDVLMGANFYLFMALYIVVISILVAILFFDAFYYLVPDKIVIPAVVATTVLALANILLSARYGSDFFIYAPGIMELLVGLLLGGGFFLILVLISKEKWMGWGDVKLGLFIGAFLGYPLVILAIFTSFIVGTIASLFLLVTGKKKRKDTIPFAPYLVIGALIALFFGRYIIEWYLGMMI